ncbi:MAG: cell division ATP-binding protein FtsE [Dolichospermum sp. DET50]|jgi:cell division transport system ATP-binding protein|nr:cell division ATP-binding protein FtsE [Dolichospermum sp. DET66]MBS3033721.1 cell division ATP-binding protein FtsE [Dolichospermum sp. DET67]MBS3038924.1 cell division ATP-binding protein FtsE [Dolichospermum sp. DET50]QSX66180.1 MAG: cell division ATP-binding protein FtsE [Dolichospermum sp. DET69]
MSLLSTNENTETVHSEAVKTQNQAGIMIELHSVSKTYINSHHALFDVNLKINRGEFLFITGASGSGKSTLLKMLYGAELPTQGKVIVDDINVGTLGSYHLSLLRRRMGIVFQDYKLIPQRTVAENVTFVLQAQGYTRKEIQRRLEPTLKLVGLLSKADRFPDQLSGGEQQRVSIARAIVGTPPLLLADEPTGNLDPDNSWQVIQIFQKLNSFGATVIITTHDEQLVRRCNYPVVQVKDGKLYRK